MSTVTGNVILKVQESHPEIAKADVAHALAIIAGAIVCFLGLTKLGRIVDFISLTSISAFMTGSAINIAVGQVPTLMGITGFDTRASTYKVVINILKHLGRTKLDAAMGLTALAMLYIIRSACNYGARRYPGRSKTFFFISTLRTAFVILLYTMISWLANRHHRKKPLFKILGKVPRGFKHAGVPNVTTDIISALASDLPSAVIVLLIEHISISKSFGRVNNYTIDPSQEMVAIGVTNLLGPFLGAYPATGSFSRTAIKSKAGVRTPFAGVITALVVLLAIYALTAVFFYIPSSSLSGVIIHAVGDLITPPNTLYQFWRVSPLEVIIFFAGVIVTVFSTIENGVYVTICLSAGVLLFRVLYARGRFMGKVQVHSVAGDQLLDNKPGQTPPGFSTGSVPEDASRNIFLPLSHNDGSNPEVSVESPYPGIFIYRFSEGFNYPNANHYTDYLVATIFKDTRRTNMHQYARLGDRPWNDPGPRRGHTEVDRSDLPTLKAIILDFSSVNNVDITSVQNLIDVRNQLDRYAAPELVQWHLACINNRWTKRALASAGFGYPTVAPPSADGSVQRWKPIFAIAELGGSSSAAAAAERRDNLQRKRSNGQNDAERGLKGDNIERSSDSSLGNDDLQKELATSKPYGSTHVHERRAALVQGLNRPFFHVDLTTALQSAIANAEERIAAQQVRKVVGTDETDY